MKTSMTMTRTKERTLEESIEEQLTSMSLHSSHRYPQGVGNAPHASGPTTMTTSQSMSCLRRSASPISPTPNLVEQSFDPSHPQHSYDPSAPQLFSFSSEASFPRPPPTKHNRSPPAHTFLVQDSEEDSAYTEPAYLAACDGFDQASTVSLSTMDPSVAAMDNVNFMESDEQLEPTEELTDDDRLTVVGRFEITEVGGSPQRNAEDESQGLTPSVVEMVPLDDSYISPLYQSAQGIMPNGAPSGTKELSIVMPSRNVSVDPLHLSTTTSNLTSNTVSVTNSPANSISSRDRHAFDGTANPLNPADPNSARENFNDMRPSLSLLTGSPSPTFSEMETTANDWGPLNLLALLQNQILTLMKEKDWLQSENYRLWKENNELRDNLASSIQMTASPHGNGSLNEDATRRSENHHSPSGISISSSQSPM